MSSTRAKLAAAAASLGVLGLGWGAVTANGATLAVTTPTTTTTAGSTAASTTTGTTTTGSTAAASGTYTDGTYTGTTTTFRFGTVTVTATISGGRITSLTETLVSDGDRHSDQINARAVPTLKTSILDANGADVTTVSGATYTSDAYLTSLQSALDQAS